MIRKILISILLIFSISCAASWEKGPKPEEIEMKIGSISFELQNTDPKARPMTAFLFPDKTDRLDMASFIRIARIPEGKSIEAMDWNEAFSREIKNDPSGRWKRLKDFLESNLSDVTVFKTGKGMKIQYFIGRYQDRLIGMKMIILEA